jgi:hypothetical protein
MNWGILLGLQHDDKLFSGTLTPGLHPEVLTNVIDELFSCGLGEVP